MNNTEKWEKAAAFHGHKCGGLAIGFKAVEALEAHYGAQFADDEQIVCVSENDTCAVDAIQALLGCTLGKGSLIYKKRGKMAFTFYFRESGKSVRIYFKAENNNLPREEWMNWILEQPAEELFTFSEAREALPERARIFRSVKCEFCGEKAREDLIRLSDGKFVCLDCFKEYDR
ncbi:MAG: FmdE family protein [Oscillospiraceae bacterium]|jgi:formylmethanofuran dehydrogenase subunit E